MHRDIDPDFALQSRLNYGSHGRYIWLPVGMTVVFILLGADMRHGAAGAMATAGGFFIAIALPFAAVALLSLERGGRLDLRRTTGRSPQSLAIALLSGTAWLPLAFGTVLLGFAWIGGAGPGAWHVLLLAALGTAAACLLLASPPPPHLDSTLLAGLVIVAGILSTLIRVPQSVAAACVVASLLASVAAFPIAVRRVARPHGASKHRTPGRLRPAADFRVTRWPDFWRALVTGGESAAGAAVLTVAAAALLVVLPRSSETQRSTAALVGTLLVYAPILIAAYECSARARVERGGGGIDRIRLASGSPWSVMAQLAGGWSLPFVAASVVVAATLVAVDVSTARFVLVAWPVIVGLLVLSGLAEGLRDRRVGSYFLPAGYVALLAGINALPLTLGIATMLWIPAAVAARALESDDPHPLGRGWAEAAFGSVAIATVLIVTRLSIPRLIIPGIIALAAGLLLPDRKPRAGAVAAYGIAIAAAIAIAEWLLIGARIAAFETVSGWPHALFGPLAFALLCGAMTGAGFVYALLIHNQFGQTPGRSLALRSLPLLVATVVNVAITTTSVGFELMLGLRFLDDRVGFNPVVFIDAGFLVLVLMVDAALMWRGIRARRRPS